MYQIYNDVKYGSEDEISMPSFRRIWKKYLPGIKFMTARSDLCTLCKSMWFSAKYWSTIETKQKLQEWQNHTTWAQLERENYK